MDNDDYIELGMKVLTALIVAPLALFIGIIVAPFIGIGWCLGWLVSKSKRLKDFVEDFD